MQATFSDPQGPRWIHAILQAPAAILLGLAVLGGFSLPYVGLLLALAVIASSCAALLPMRQKKPIAATLELGPGYVRVKGTKLRSPVLRAKDITGASTAKTDGGYALSLARGLRDTPTTLVVPTEAEVDRLRLALGVGHGGHGALAWWTMPTQTQRSAFGGRIAAALATLGLLATAAFAGDSGIWALSGMVGFFAIPIGLLLSALGAQRSAYPEIEMTAMGIRLLTTAGPFLLPYAHYNGFTRTGDELVFTAPPPWNTVRVPVRAPVRGSGLTEADLEVLRAQLDGASLRARGYGRTKEEVAGRVEVLRRGRESARDWLARLDLLGQTLRAGPGYRGQSLDAEDLWAVLEDPDAEADLRTAAARVLRHGGEREVRLRIDAAVAAIRDEHVNVRVRVAAQEELEEAAATLEEADSHDRVRRMVR